MNDRTCNRCNRPLSTRQAKYCSHACANRSSTQARAKQRRDEERKRCDVEACGKPARSRTAELCPMHYHRVYRYGSLNPTHEPTFADLTGKRYGTLTPVRKDGQFWVCQCDCGRTRRASIGELNRTGDNNTCGHKANHLRDDVDYAAAHSRLAAYRGSASRHQCTDCGGDAYHWSYNHNDPDERISWADRTAGIAYSLNVNMYEPRCVPCHKRFDLAKLNATAF